jgi:multisubunit Na+/H+ antiporter MnhE subunit
LLAPLPRLYRIIVVASVLVVGIVAGVWVAQSYALPTGGLLVGTGAGLVVAYLLTHDFHQRPRPVRIHRRH